MLPKTITVTVTTDDAKVIGQIVIRLRGEPEPQPAVIEYGWGSVQFNAGAEADQATS